MTKGTLKFKISLFSLFFVFLLCGSVSLQTTGDNIDRSLRGSVAVGYSHIYNFELNSGEKISGNFVRADIILKYKKLFLESDYQQIFFEEGTSHFFHNSLGYRLYSGARMPDLYVLGAYVHANKFPIDGLIYNEDHSGPGLGLMMGMTLETLLSGDASFALTYFPIEQMFYKNMQVGWELKYIGLSIGGVGARVPGGRLYSGFTFTARYKWSVKGRKNSSSNKQ